MSKNMAAWDRRRILKRRLLLLIILRRRFRQREDELRRQRGRKRFWVRRIFLERKQKRDYHALVKEIMLFDHQYFFKMFRMLPSKFEELLALVGPKLKRDSTRREAIKPEERLCVTLKYLASGDSFISIGSSYRMSSVTVGRIVTLVRFYGTH